MTKDKYEVEETWVARDGGDDERMAEAEEEEEECKIREDDGDAAAAAVVGRTGMRQTTFVGILPSLWS